MSSQEGRIPGRHKEEGEAELDRTETGERTPASVLGLAVAPGTNRFSVEDPYDQRRCIVVVPDDVIVVESSAQQGLKRKAGADERAEAILDALHGSHGAALASDHALSNAVRGVARFRAAGHDLRMVGATDAQQISWPPGHPFEGVVYAGHPGVAGLYYPLAEFHQRVFEHKFCEAIDLLMSLGASRLRVKGREGLGKDEVGAMELAFTPRQPPSRGRENPEHYLFEAELPGSRDPQIPTDTVWLDSERSWQTLAKARVRHHTESFSLTVRYENDYGIEPTLVGALHAAGLGIGGSFHRQVDTVWDVEAEFPSAAPSKGSPAEGALDAPSLFS